MGICKDPWKTYLNGLGFNVVRLPREGLNPLDLLGRQGGGTARVGTLDDIFDGSFELPPVRENQEAASFSGQQTEKLSLGLGLNLLGSIIGAMGGQSLGLKAEYKKAKKVTFMFEQVLTDTAEAAEVGKSLATAELDAASPFVEEYILGNGRLFVLTSTLKARRIRVTTEGSSGTTVDLEVPVIQQAVGAKVKVTANSEQSAAISYEGKRYLTFGFQLFELGLEGGQLRLFMSPANSIALNQLGEISRSDLILDPQGLTVLEV